MTIRHTYRLQKTSEGRVEENTEIRMLSSSEKFYVVMGGGRVARHHNSADSEGKPPFSFPW